MCYLILLLPIFALPAFWLLPAGEAAGLYLVVLLVSTGVYWLAVRAMRAPPIIGIEALMHSVGTVRGVDGRKAWVWVQSELWSAEAAPGTVHSGDTVEVIGARGLILQIQPAAGRDGHVRATANCARLSRWWKRPGKSPAATTRPLSAGR